ncbi:MAG: hypothetical protein ABI210_04650 [Abditibacteriaceae bacterium]
MNRLNETYRAFYQQGFIPIFVQDDDDPKTQVTAAVTAGCSLIEYTQRRFDAPEMIPWIKREFPDLHIVIGSVLDDDSIVRQQRRHYPQLRTLDEWADLGVDGFVSMLGWKRETIAKWSSTHFVVPSAMTLREANLQMSAGAHFIKMDGRDLDLVKRCGEPPVFGFCPIFVTGGMTLDRIPIALRSGAVAVAAGFDLITKESGDITEAILAEAIRRRIELVKEYRGEVPEDLNDLPHYIPNSIEKQIESEVS